MRFLVGARMVEVWAELEEPVGSEALADKLAAIREQIDGSFKDASDLISRAAARTSTRLNVPLETTSQEV